MPSDSPSQNSPSQNGGNPHVFTAVEELDEAVQALGWDIEYRKLDRGKFRAESASLECDGISLLSLRFTNHLEIPSGAPAGYVGICFPRFDAGRAMVCGREWNDGEAVVFPSRSEMEFVTRGENRNETLLVPEADFLAAARSLAPSANLISPGGSAAIVHGDPGRFEAIVRDIDTLHGNGGLDRESASNLVARTILWMMDAAGKSNARRLTNNTELVIARRARDFIDDRLCDTIRLEDVCAHAGAGLRTVQRCFASRYQVSPFAYLKARRLNAARRDLAAANPSERSVTEVAMDNGLSHLGRFSIEYREHFGESPKETLARQSF